MIALLSDTLVFPPLENAEPDGLLAVGGDLRPDRLLLAYRSGIFPWYCAGEPILWWSPDPRSVLFADRLKVSNSLARTVRAGRFRITFDRDFAGVIARCRTTPRPGQDGTWITREMIRAYTVLHRQGYAHSVEAWDGDTLAGGLYGVAVGGAFFGESMFAHVSNASKVALVHLVQRLRDWGYAVIDCQVHNAHLARLGAETVPRSAFMRILRDALAIETPSGSWTTGEDEPHMQDGGAPVRRGA